MQDATDQTELTRLRMAVAATGDVVYDWDLQAGVLHWSENAAAVLGVEDAAGIADMRAYQARIAPDDAPLRALTLSRHLQQRQAFACSYKIRRDDGGHEWVEERAVVHCDADGEPIRMVGVLRAFTDAKSLEERLQLLAYRDELSGRLNRARMTEVVRSAITRCVREGSISSYLLVNMDNLGALNEASGYDVVDDVIVRIGERIAACVGADASIGRMSGNQYGVLLAGHGDGSLTLVGERILASVRGDLVKTQAGPIAVSVSIGAATMNAATRDVRDVFGRAEEALDQAKRQGRDCLVVYRVSTEKAALRRSALTSGDRVLRALRDNRLALAFQPIVDARTRQPVQYECLLRMRAEDGSIVAAGAFVPAVEKLGLVRLLDLRTMEMALAELRAAPDLHLAVNVSGLTAVDPSAIRELMRRIRADQQVASRLTVEITETAAMQDVEQTVRLCGMLREIGAKLALDDFGAGYTSFRHLKMLDVDCVKIDGQFVQNLDQRKDNQLFVRTLVDLAEGFGLETVAECVETETDAQLLIEHGVGFLQGYYFGRPSLERHWQAATPPARPAAGRSAIAAG